MRRLAFACALAGSLAVSGCAQMDESNKYAISGMVAGAAIGGSVAAGMGDPFLGTAAIGGLVGGALGFVYGEFMGEEDEQADENRVLF